MHTWRDSRDSTREYIDISIFFMLFFFSLFVSIWFNTYSEYFRNEEEKMYRISNSLETDTYNEPHLSPFFQSSRCDHMQTLIRRIAIVVACFLFELRRTLFSYSVCRRIDLDYGYIVVSIGKQMSANLCFVAADRYIQSSKAKITTKTPWKCILVQNCRSLISRWKGNESGRLFALSWTKEKDEIKKKKI